MSYEDDTTLYDPELLKKIDLQQYCEQINQCSPISGLHILHPADGLIVRPLNSADYDKGFLDMIRGLTSMGIDTKEDFGTKFEAMKNCNNSYYVTVVEDTRRNLVIGAATLLLEHKFLRGVGLRGFLEDVVVREEYRGRKIGKILVSVITDLAKYLGCYKVTLNCKSELLQFYSSLGYASGPGQANCAMTIRFDPPNQNERKAFK